MNNNFKLIGGSGAALLALRAIYYAFIYDNIHLDGLLGILGFILIAVGFFMVPASNQISNITSPTASNENPNTIHIPTVGEWVGWLLLLCIPLVNLIIMIIWAIDKENPIRRNWILASLIITAVVTVLYMLLFFSMMSSYRF